MKSLFGDNRLADILDILRKTSAIDIHALASQLGVSTRTIRNDVKTLNGRLSDSGIIEIEQGSCCLIIFDEAAFRKTYTKLLDNDDLLNSPANRRNYIFGKLMRAVEPVLTDDLAYEMNVGRSTLIKDLTQLREDISGWDLAIKGITSKGLMLAGEELNIRRYVLENNYDAIFEGYPQDEVVLQYETEAFEHQSFDGEVEEEFDRYYTLMIDRFMTGHFIGRLPDAYYNLTAHAGFSFADHLLNQLGNRLHVEFPIEEKVFVFMPIAGMRIPSDTEKLSRIELDSSIQPLVDEIERAIFEEMGFEIDLDGYAEEFMYHLMFMINRLRYHVRIENPIGDEVRAKYPLAARIADIAGRVIEQSCHVTMTRDELGFLTSYFGVFVNESAPERPQSYAIVYTAGRVNARLILAQVKRVIDSASQVDMYTVGEATPEVLDRYDVVLSTVDLGEATSTPVIYIREVIDEQDLRNKLEKVSYLGRGDVASVDDNRFVMTSLLRSDHFFLLEGVSGYEDAVGRMVDSLTAAGELDEGFAERLAERERVSTMVIGGGIALPHATNKAADDVVLAIGIVPEAQEDGGEPIRLIFLIALPETSPSDELLVRIYDEILSIVNDREMLERIFAADSYPKLLRALYKRI